jgi:hypothetical protein
MNIFLYSQASRRALKASQGRLPIVRAQIRLSSSAVAQGKSEKSTNNEMKPLGPLLSRYPLSGMPTGMLLRSLFIASISSTRLLLIPSLHLIAFFDKPGRSFLFNVDRNPILHAILKKTIYNQFCAGETLKETSACVRSLKDLGFRGVILTYAKELVEDRDSLASRSEGRPEVLEDGKATPERDATIEEWRTGTSKTIDMIEKGDILAIKYVLFLT